MPRRLGGLLPALFLALAGGVLVSAPAQGQPVQPARCDQPSVKQAAKGAEVVFEGTLTRGSGSDASSYSFQAETLYAGDLASRSVTVRATDRCPLTSLREGKRYVVFARQNQGALVSGVEDGTTRAKKKAMRQVERVLGEGEALTGSQAEPGAPTFTRVDHSTPPRLTRVAAPGAALVLVGLLGLLVVRRRA